MSLEIQSVNSAGQSFHQENNTKTVNSESTPAPAAAAALPCDKFEKSKEKTGALIGGVVGMVATAGRGLMTCAFGTAIGAGIGILGGKIARRVADKNSKAE
ncbi:MAG: hypothetical protein LUE64_00485 [Candidatus Gastranaerophilales bacterium]|nr:hypothetical protein [Candidatus Gastranaerophilales bacterium]